VQLYTRQRQEAKQPAEDEADRAEMKETVLLLGIDIRNERRGKKKKTQKLSEARIESIHTSPERNSCSLIYK